MDFTYKDITIAGVVLGWVSSVATLWATCKNKIKRNSDDIKEINKIIYTKNHELNLVTVNQLNEHKVYFYKKVDEFNKIADNCIKCQRSMDNKFHDIELALNTIIVHFKIERTDKIVLSDRRKNK